MSTKVHDEDPLMVPVADVHKLAPSWPWSVEMTYKHIARGALGCIRVGRRVFLRRADLEAFVTRHAKSVP